jgi:hypothetical protein
MTPKLRRWLFTRLGFALLLLPITLLLVQPQSVAAQSNEFSMDRYDAEITVNPDGSYDVVETLDYDFQSGAFKRGLREIPLDRVEDITDVRVTEITDGAAQEYRETSFNEDDDRAFGVPGTFGTKIEGNKLRIRWIFDEVFFGGNKSFELRYKVHGAMREYDNHYVVDWKAIPPDWQGEIENSRVTVSFPDGTKVNKYNDGREAIESKPQVAFSHEGNNVVWSDTNVNDGLEVGVQVLKGGPILTTKPSWQPAADTMEAVMVFVNLGMVILGVLLLIGGPLWTIWRWYKYGRDLPVGLHSDYVAEPPSDLPPGLVGTLLDESADVRDVIATVVDQGRKGNLVIRETSTGGLFSSKEFQYEQTGGNFAYRFEEMVNDAIFKHGNPVNLSDLKNSFYSDLPPIYAEMYRNLVAMKYFPEDPSAVRARNVGVGILFLILAAGVIAAQIFIFDGISLFGMVPAVGLIATGVVRLAFARAMPRKTDFGAEQAQRWRAFRNYLQQMQQYTNVQAAADKYQQYLPYAVALGVDKELTRQFESVPTAMPPYYIPMGWYPYPVGTPMGGQSVGGPAGMGGDGGGAFDMGGAMQSMSEGLGSAMQGMSDSFTSMVNSASSILTSQPSSSGSGWSGGGGGGFGGGGGGGGGGGAD